MKRPKCATCAHFHPGDRYSLDYGWCGLAAAQDGCPVRHRLTWAELDERAELGHGPPEDWPPMYAEDGSSYRAGLRVRPSFGCVAWKKKEVEA